MALQIGSRVEVNGKDSRGTVAFIGITAFASGRWVGVILDEPKGKNNGTVQGKQYFKCEENHGTFVRITHLSLIDEHGNKTDLSKSASIEDMSPKSTPGSTGLKSRFGSSRSSILGKAPQSMNREDVMGFSTPEGETALKRSAFVEKLAATTPTSRMKTRISMAKSLSNLNKTKPNTPQTSFVETLRPQFTLGQVLTSPGVSTQRPPQAAAIDSVEHEGLKAQVKDLGEKLETMKIKYKEKVHEIDSLHLKLDQAAEFKIKIMESQAALKKELELVKKEKQDAIEAHDDVSDLTDALEMATLDKEMAEEKAEGLQIELSDTKERLEEMTLDYKLLEEEFRKVQSSTGEGDENSVSAYEMKQLKLQNARLHDTLIRVRDLAANEKHETQKLLKDLEDRKSEINELRKITEKYKTRINEMEQTISELHEQVDAALGAEEMVETLGLQKLTLEDKIKELEEAVSDLEALQEINDQLQEDGRELEVHLREDVDLANSATREAQREKENALEELADRELTIIKFRELVQKLQDQCQDLQVQLQKESSSHDSMKMSIPEMLDFKKMFAETRAQARAIDLELRRMEVLQGQQHIQYLVAFMPDSFTARGGDNDAVLTMILITRLQWKCEILLSQMRDKFPSVELSNKGELVKGHTAEQFASRCRLSYHLHLMQAVLRQFKYGLDTCSTDILMKTSASLPEMSQQEKILDGYIELLKTDKLDENVRTENIKKCVNYFNTMHTLLLYSSGEKCVHECKLLLDHTVAFTTACDSIRTDVAIIQALIQEDDTSDISPVCQQLATVAEVTQKHLKQIRRTISAFPDTKTLPIPNMATNLLKISVEASKLVHALREIAKTSFSQIALTTDDIHLSSQKLLEISNCACEKIFEDKSRMGAVACLKNSLRAFTDEIENIYRTILEKAETILIETATEKHEEIMAPLLVRAAQVKKELEQTKTLQSKLNSKDNDIKELKTILKVKQEEIGELNIRKDIAEKKLANSDSKLSNTIRDYDINIQKLQRKLEEANQLMKRKETEFEETMDHLQADIDSLECEKGELKDKLKTYSKKVLIDGIKNSNVSAGNVSIGNLSSPTSFAAFYESPFLINEIKALRIMLSEERSKRNELEAKYYKQLLDKLEPIPVFKQDSEIDSEILDLQKRIKSYQNDLTQYVAQPKVIDLTKRIAGTFPTLIKSNPRYQLQKQIDETKNLATRFNGLQTEYVKLASKKRSRSQIVTDIINFPAPVNKMMLADKAFMHIGTLNVPCNAEFSKQGIVDVNMENTEDLITLVHTLLKCT